MSAQYEPLPNIRRDARNKARNKSLQKERAQAMTTDAPTEKMTNAVKKTCGENCRYPYCIGPSNPGCNQRAEAARRLAAPAVPSREEIARTLCAVYMDHLSTPFDILSEDGKQHWLKYAEPMLALFAKPAPDPAAPRVGDDGEVEPRYAILEAELESGALQGLSRKGALQLIHELRAALSAPPAASADARDVEIAGLRQAMADAEALLYREYSAAAMKHAREIIRTALDLPAGYRKLAPAQSVGQSAAQGVALDEHEPTCAMVKPRLMLPMPACTCRLPKGQDDEG